MPPAVAGSLGCATIAIGDNATTAKPDERKLGGNSGVRPTAAISARSRANRLTAFASHPIGAGTVVPAYPEHPADGTQRSFRLVSKAEVAADLRRPIFLRSCFRYVTKPVKRKGPQTFGM